MGDRTGDRMSPSSGARSSWKGDNATPQTRPTRTGRADGASRSPVGRCAGAPRRPLRTARTHRETAGGRWAAQPARGAMRPATHGVMKAHAARVLELHGVRCRRPTACRSKGSPSELHTVRLSHRELALRLRRAPGGGIGDQGAHEVDAGRAAVSPLPPQPDPTPAVRPRQLDLQVLRKAEPRTSSVPGGPGDRGRRRPAAQACPRKPPHT